MNVKHVCGLQEHFSRVVCSALSCPHCKPMTELPDIKGTLSLTAIINRIINNSESSYHEEINSVAEWCKENIYCPTSAKPSCWLLILERRSQTHTPLTTSVEQVEQVNSLNRKAHKKDPTLTETFLSRAKYLSVFTAIQRVIKQNITGIISRGTLGTSVMWDV